MSENQLHAQPSGTISREEDVKPYEVPELLESSNGVRIVTAHDWVTKRRPELLKLFSEQVYGHFPPLASGQHPDIKITFEKVDEDKTALNGLAIRKQVQVKIARGEQHQTFELLIYQPLVKQPVPVFLGLNFKGNHTIHTDPAIRISPACELEYQRLLLKNPKTLREERGSASKRWPVEMILKGGYAVATIYYDDIDPDWDDGFQNGLHPLFYDKGQTRPHDHEWGSIGAWSWGLSRALDYLESDATFDAKNVALLGHSRLGKTALWAGVNDERFAMVISNNSGCGGAALSKRIFGETVGRINQNFPHWFCKNFHQFSHRETEMTFDQHQLLALVAPRPLYVASATEDLWADPQGEFLATLHAQPAYELFNLKGLGTHQMPPADQPLKQGTLGYHLRTGKHEITDYDWSQYLDFAEMHFAKNK